MLVIVGLMQRRGVLQGWGGGGAGEFGLVFIFVRFLFCFFYLFCEFIILLKNVN